MMAFEIGAFVNTLEEPSLARCKAGQIFWKYRILSLFLHATLKHLNLMDDYIINADTVDKYNGYLTNSYEDHQFQSEALLCFSTI